jgi:hypothetical protein
MAADHVFVKADCMQPTTGIALVEYDMFVTERRVTRRHGPVAR